MLLIFRPTKNLFVMHAMYKHNVTMFNNICYFIFVNNFSTDYNLIDIYTLCVLIWDYLLTFSSLLNFSFYILNKNSSAYVRKKQNT